MYFKSTMENLKYALNANEISILNIWQGFAIMAVGNFWIPLSKKMNVMKACFLI